MLFDCAGVGGPPGHACAVLLSNLFLLPRRLPELLALPREAFDTFDEVAAAGWRVD